MQAKHFTCDEKKCDCLHFKHAVRTVQPYVVAEKGIPCSYYELHDFRVTQERPNLLC
jgi:hypothetical protein